MPKIRTVYTCQNCNYQASHWVGQCPQCGEWNTFIEDVVVSQNSKSGSHAGKGVTIAPIQLSKISTKNIKRLSSNISEFDRVLGGGFVPGQVVLLAGEPGIGKSTILTDIAKSLGDKKILYVAGEESPDQIKIRAERMGYPAENLFILQESGVEQIISVAEAEKDLALIIVDSVQTIYSDEIAGISGSLPQVRGCTQLLTMAAKRTGIPVVLVGHVNKEGVVAGPKVLEHIVDTILYLEGDPQHMFRMLRTSKNRFGPVSEVGIFEMQEKGMKEVKNPSELFLEEHVAGTSGSCIAVVMEGYRPLLFEVQALTIRTSFGYPRRTASGFNANRLQVLVATIEKRTGIDLSGHDIYLNIAGGFKISEYAADLAVCIAVISSVKDLPIKEKSVVYGEVGLNGEVRRVSHTEKRSKEAKKLGFEIIISPETAKSLNEAVSKALSKGYNLDSGKHAKQNTTESKRYNAVKPV
ncbi:MAG: repair protein radA protein [candidate division WWE3 bacterium GW2011_GWF2_41_45]|uniref:DNA repair protein RadA n=2 Tax=Katanobacteria TaxID=422282 RepID=A0A1F4W2N7_UNCKA|nr:MAG: repair protein radA protein [candidate division WWE3 bacterium GW2011_GWC2_41_23]KKS10192.1 MAG: repair protein radA protein [candidate division WWE3 bacterium GW2011_GWF2_41_45]KKS19537.1 MAG: repair protein radA protein [candidate division WWE3 bacterium GW2011_GWE1_41_72]KKS26652.1 MAG: repair protein radA protein [candidate division WWE3 bacterium GW2011_GWC1_42_102]KKS28653.1 MAG: repair protein radA protein [candidate division WWE3 bacterium GW2011_GWD2_42_11]KKS49839.1 MAG: repa